MDPEDYSYEADDGDTKPQDANPFVSGIKLIRLSKTGIGSSLTILLQTNQRLQDLIALYSATGWQIVQTAPPNFEPSGDDSFDLPNSVMVTPEWRKTRWFPDWLDKAPPVEP